MSSNTPRPMGRDSVIRQPRSQTSMPLARNTSTAVTDAKPLSRGKYSKKSDVGSDGTPIQLLANFFKIEIDVSKVINHYHIEINHVQKKSADEEKLVEAKRSQKPDILKKVFADNKIDIYAFDGNANLYTPNVLPKNTIRTSVNVDKRDSVFEMKISHAASLKLNLLKDYIDGNAEDAPNAVINMLNIIMTQVQGSNLKIDKRCIYDMNRLENLGRGVAYVTGYYLSAKATQAGLVKNIDLACASFYKPILLTEFLQEINSRVDFSRKLPGDASGELEKCIKGIMVQPVHLKNPKNYIVRGLTAPASQITFKYTDEENNERIISVAEYFASTNRPLKCPEMPCVKVGDRNNPIFYPIELCRIVSGQKYKKPLTTEQRQTIITVTAVAPKERLERINQLASRNELSFLKHFGILFCDSQMQRVNARVLNAPEILYRNLAKQTVRNGQWQMANSMSLFKSPELNNWAVVWMANKDTRKFRRMPIEQVKERMYDFIRKVFNSKGLTNNVPGWLDAENMNLNEVFDAIQKDFGIPQLVVFVINNDDQYENIKHLAERDEKYGFITQCARLEKLGQFVDDDFKLTNYLTNILLKVNAKIGGVNNKASYENIVNQKVVKEPVMFIGADVTHHTFDTTKPSIAAVVGSVDISLTNYCVRLCEQMHHNENKQSIEIILELEDIVFSLLSSFQKRNNGILPKRIVFYRDGIDEGQFKAVREFELNAIRKAYKRLNASGEPAISFIVVQKRNNTRLFPLCSMQNRKGNIVSGTVVDTAITSVNEFDFYLCSQDSGQGTAKPTHYWVLYDDNNFSANDIQNLTYLLCHLYARCTKAVSIPAPVYYAHLAATRGRLHYNYEHQDDESIFEGNIQQLNRARLIEIHPNLQETMFFL